MTTRGELEAALEARRSELRARESAYLKAKALLESEDGKVKHDALLTELFLTIDQFSPGDSGDKAIALIAVAKRVVKQIQAPRNVVLDYEDRKARIEDISKKIEDTAASR
jgi:hypothetical protein